MIKGETEKSSPIEVPPNPLLNDPGCWRVESVVVAWGEVDGGEEGFD